MPILQLRHNLLYVVENWPILRPKGPACPIKFSAEERKAIRKEFAEVKWQNETMASVNHALGVDPGGWVPNEDYDAAVAANARHRDAAARSAASEFGVSVDDARKGWPY